MSATTTTRRPVSRIDPCCNRCRFKNGCACRCSTIRRYAERPPGRQTARRSSPFSAPSGPGRAKPPLAADRLSPRSSAMANARRTRGTEGLLPSLGARLVPCRASQCGEETGPRDFGRLGCPPPPERAGAPETGQANCPRGIGSSRVDLAFSVVSSSSSGSLVLRYCFGENECFTIEGVHPEWRRSVPPLQKRTA